MTPTNSLALKVPLLRLHKTTTIIMDTTTTDESNNREAKKFQKSYFDVLGICCTSEVPLIEKILNPLDGVKQVSVFVLSKTVIVIHDSDLISQIQIVKLLNQAGLDANIRVYGDKRREKKWPSLYTIGCGVLLLGSFFKHFFDPLKWLAVAAVVVGLPPILIRCYAAVKILTLDINVLVLIAVGGTMAVQDYWEAASMVFLFTIAEWLESRASNKATEVMSSLMSMAPQKAVLAENGLIVDAKDVEINTIIAVKAGEVIPIDGIVVDGSCEVDEKSLTGEPYPVSKQYQSKVLAGTISLNGYISVKTTVLADDCAVAKMVKLVEEAQNNKSQTQRFIDKCALYYTPAVVIISVGLAAVPAALKVHDLRHWIHLALIVLVSACPCALILSTPVATFCALTKAATNGLLIKGGDYLEILAKVKIVAFDKTGTLTKGEFSVTDFLPTSDEVSLDDLLYWVSSIESKSSHPMAAALIDYGRFNSIEPRPENVSEYQNFPGEGICGEIDGKKLYVGNKKMATRAGCEIVSDHSRKGTTIGYVFLGATQVGIFSLSDSCRLGVAEAVNKLKTLKIKSVMLTGDSLAAAMRCQNQLGNAIDVIHADLLPEEKAKIIKELKEEGPTAMIGDGVNDAPALATADIGISMGISGSALATETGNITLMSNDVGKIPEAVQLARRTRRKIVENVIISFVIKTAILALAVSGYPLLWAAVLADVGTCLLVIFNSMLLLHGTTKHSQSLSSCDKKDCCKGSETKPKSPIGTTHVMDSSSLVIQIEKDDHGSVSSCEKKGCCKGSETKPKSPIGTTHGMDSSSLVIQTEKDDHGSVSSCEKKGCCKGSETKPSSPIGTTHGMDSSSLVIQTEKDDHGSVSSCEKKGCCKGSETNPSSPIGTTHGMDSSSLVIQMENDEDHHGSVISSCEKKGCCRATNGDTSP